MLTIHRYFLNLSIFFFLFTMNMYTAESAVGNQPKVYDLLEKGIASCQNGNYDEGIAYFSRAIAIDPNNYFAYLNRGIAYKDQNDYDIAASDFNTCIRIDNKNPEAFFQLGNVSSNQGDYEKAVIIYSKAITVDSNFIKAYGARAIINTMTGNLNNAINDINAAIAKEPEFPMLYIIRGQVLDLKGECRSALYDFENAMSYDAETFNANGNIAWILATCPEKKYRDGPKALKLAEQELKSQETHENLKIIAAAYAEIGDFKNAVQFQEKAIEKIKQIHPVNKFEEMNIQKDLKVYQDQLASYQNKIPWHLRPPVQHINTTR